MPVDWYGQQAEKIPTGASSDCGDKFARKFPYLV
jgi:hypothetical protein